MKYTKLGSYSASVLGFGCWQLGGKYWGDVDVAQCMRAIERAVELGINLFDTAPIYGEGLADRRLVQALGSKRHDMIIATKAGVDMRGEHARSYLNPSFLEEDIALSLRRLQIESIPLLQIHWPCESKTPLEETFTTLARLQEKGDIQCIGVCNYSTSDIKEIQQYVSLTSTQNAYSMLRREIEDTIIPVAHEHNLTTIGYEVLCRGLLAGKYQSQPTFPSTDLRSHDPRFQGDWLRRNQFLVHQLIRAANKLDVPTCALPLAWSLKRVDIALMGIKNTEQLLQNCQSLRLAGKERILSLVEAILDLSPRQ
ncbi:MAG: aldo/keto reductase [Myxococcota bacterium]|nr:aldo/keto reductase [Myxococcota bacterium]